MFLKSSQNLGDDWLNPRSHRRRLIGPTQEVGHAGQDADGRLLAHLGKGLGQQRQVSTRDDLGSLEQRIRTAGGPVDKALDVGIPKDGVAAGHRHRDETPLHQQAIEDL